MGDKSQSCMCSKRRQQLLASERRRRCKRLRQTLVCDQDEGRHYEPYLQFVHEEYSPASSECDSEVELPWDEFAISVTELAKRDKSTDNEEKVDEAETAAEETEPVKKVSSGFIHLPWEELVVTDTVQSELAKKEVDNCDSALEIPWEDILYDSRIKITASDEELKKCDKDVIEIPWNDLLIPEGISLAPKMRCQFFSAKARKKSKKCGCSKHKSKGWF